MNPKTRSWREIVTRDPCVYCVVWPNTQRTRDQMTVEHVTPIAHGGRRTAWENRAGAHKACNHDRGDMPLLKFLIVKQRLMSLRGKANHRARRQLRHDWAVSRTLN